MHTLYASFRIFGRMHLFSLPIAHFSSVSCCSLVVLLLCTLLSFSFGGRFLCMLLLCTLCCKWPCCHVPLLPTRSAENVSHTFHRPSWLPAEANPNTRPTPETHPTNQKRYRDKETKQANNNSNRPRAQQVVWWKVKETNKVTINENCFENNYFVHVCFRFIVVLLFSFSFVFLVFSIWPSFLPSLSAYDHTSTNAPETIRTRKLNVLGPV